MKKVVNSRVKGMKKIASMASQTLRVADIFRFYHGYKGVHLFEQFADSALAERGQPVKDLFSKMKDRKLIYLTGRPYKIHIYIKLAAEID